MTLGVCGHGVYLQAIHISKAIKSIYAPQFSPLLVFRLALSYIGCKPPILNTYIIYSLSVCLAPRSTEVWACVTTASCHFHFFLLLLPFAVRIQRCHM